MLQSTFQFIAESGFVGWVILVLGFVTLGLIIERTRDLFFRYNIDSEKLSQQVLHLVRNRRADEALSLLAQYRNQPIARALSTIVERADREDEAIFQAQDIALAETTPLLTVRLQYLSMLANVATLAGLLGTIHGLILSFAAVAQADPAQKQILLANGISVSMYTTALGLIVAIPAMVAFAILVTRQNKLTEDLFEKTTRLTETLTSQHLWTKEDKASA